MKAMRKLFPNSELFPFQLIYKDTKSPQSELPNHFHDWYEIVYVYSGKGMFFIDTAFYEMKAGDVFLIPKDTIHRAMPDKHDPVTSSILFFSPLVIQNVPLGEAFDLPAFFESVRKGKLYRPPLDRHNQTMLRRHIETIREELAQSKQGYRFAARLTLHRIILEISRMGIMDFTVTEASMPNGAPWLKEILLHMENNLSGHLTLSALAHEALVSPEHFSRVFKQMTGMNLTAYIHTKRIIKARNLLIETTLAIPIVAEHCGFESLPHFHRTFKKYTGQTPAAFRKESQR
ncbi:AraC family transcriptional regulator [Paenibacillus sp. GP183]|uniref:AraC family transcriptional regulator n=1 Tax=Paenibacillus sp. GP183 TaxID=1882751 RepID=UPI00089D5803|nr:AraC family transcriptional regulator [Paenibacillus sp. GP183]SEC74505.1 transcriptional regulator, AraC family [Paenibacillus sp. GP183]